MSGGVAIIGAGLAGAIAACRLASRGILAAVYTARPGATFLHGGGFYLGSNPSEWSSALTFAQTCLPALDIVLQKVDGIDVEGTRRRPDAAPATHAAMNLLGNRPAVANLVPAGHPFANMQRFGTAVDVDFPARESAFGRSFASLAPLFDAEETAYLQLRCALSRALEGGAFTGLLLPPILGLRRTEELRARLSLELGLPVAEAFGTTPSTPGLRLAAALVDALETAKLPVHRSKVTAVQLDPLGLWIGDDLLPARAIIVACGGPLITGHEQTGPAEVALGLLPIEPRLSPDPLRSSGVLGPYGGALFASGVRIDAQSRVLGHDHQPLHSGLFAAGDVTTDGTDPVLSRDATGRALRTAYAAAEAIAREHG
ncbi:MAG: hypothetical protein EXR76_08835 [Myxococcales bacterium]|nr:hypothetical protein [Myxococcales bacterium]